jgi:muconate cycloisomerase
MGRHECAGRNPAAFCALETALLDLWANVEKKPIYQLFCNPSHQDTLIYSGVIPAAEDKTTLMNYIALVNRLGLASIKIKVTDSAVGLEQLTLMRNHLGREVDIRVDANAAFTADAALQFIKRAKAVKLSAIEQPVPKNDLVGLKRVTDSSNVPIFADESMYTKEGPLHLIDNGICHGINIRLSSCGGFRRAFQLYHHARSNKMLVMLGAHVGETAILSYAGRNLAMMCPAARYLEGSFSTYVLTADLVDEDISLGPGGRVPSPAAPGLGIQIHPCAIKKWAEPFASLSLETPNG